ncbi:MAG: rRNA maturation RNase YbeY [Flavobacteriales bacterium]|nr:rRNA maturation RNase YbeY [Flavobacteriales bacterium]
MAAIRFCAHGVSHAFREKARLERWLCEVARSRGHDLGELSFILMSDEELLRYNTRYLGHRYFTDVITFDAEDRDAVGGDVLISLDRVRDNARSLGRPVQEELRRVMVHGLLHLLGYRDRTVADKMAMRRIEDECLLAYPQHSSVQRRRVRRSNKRELV